MPVAILVPLCKPTTYISVPHIASWIAPHLSDELKTSIADTAMEALFSKNKPCSTPAGDAALEQLRARLIRSSDMDYHKPFTVIQHPMTNAVTLPDDRIIIFSGLIKDAESQNEVAGVLAHELGHVYYKHPAEGLVQSLGGQILFMLMFGGSYDGVSSQQIVQALMQSSYQRDMEHEADDAAIMFLNQAQLSAQGLEDFFTRIGKEEGDSSMLDYISTHPNTKERISKMHQAVNTQDTTYYAPALSASEWQALKTICKDTPEQIPTQ